MSNPFVIVPKIIGAVKKINQGLGVKRSLSKGKKKSVLEIEENDYVDAKPQNLTIGTDGSIALKHGGLKTT